MPFDFFPHIGLLLFFSIVFMIVHSAGTLTACALTGVKVEKIVLFYGKPVFTFQTHFCPICIGYIPTGGYISHDMQSFPNRPLLVRGFVALAGLLAVSLSAMICLNIGHAAISFIATYPQLVKGTLAPRSFGSDLFASFFAKARISLFLGYGTLAAKYVAITMLPVPGGVMGQLLLQLAKKRHEDKLITIYSLFTTLVTLPILICWAIALVSYFWRNH